MKHILLAAAAVALLGAAPAAAQYGPYGGYGGGYGAYGGGYGHRGWDEDDDRPRYRRRHWGEHHSYERRVQVGSICYTARGSCRTHPAPVRSGCGCNIPGFGFKRGAIVAGGY